MFYVVQDIFTVYVMIASCFQNDIVRIINIYVSFRITNVPTDTWGTLNNGVPS